MTRMFRRGRLASTRAMLLLALFACGGRAAPARSSPQRNAATQDASDTTYQAWVGYNSTFLFHYADGSSLGFTKAQGGAVGSGFWEDAEQIEMADDAFEWAVRRNPKADHKKFADEIDGLCFGFVNYVRPAANDDWSGNRFNDDLNWAIIAFARAYQATGNARWLAAAKTNFHTVWARAQVGDGGLRQIQGGTNEDAPVNFTFVIAGRLLYRITGDASFKTEADSVYAWAVTNGNLYVEATGKVYDSTTGHSDYSYNYGTAIGAAAAEADPKVVKNVLSWLTNNSNNPNFPYVGTYNGFHILPNYGQGGRNNGGYNGIALRWIGYASSLGYLTAGQLAWAQANVNKASSLRNSSNVIWNKWDAPTPENGFFSWDCSSALVGLLDIPQA